MRNFVGVLAMVVFGFSFSAMAQISNSKHDLSFGSTAAVKSTSNTQTQICIFCHTPHRSIQQDLIWNHKASLNATPGFSANTTVAGTPLPTTTVTSISKACLDCHDGSVAIGDVNNVGAGVAGVIAVNAQAGNVDAAGKMITGGAYTVGFGGNLDNNHPISIPYAGATYNSITSGAVASATLGEYFTVATTGCTSPTGVCTSATTNGPKIALFGTTATNVGVECGSCHDVHNTVSGNGYFLRAPAAGSAICLACHNK